MLPLAQTMDASTTCKPRKLADEGSLTITGIGFWKTGGSDGNSCAKTDAGFTVNVTSPMTETENADNILSERVENMMGNLWKQIARMPGVLLHHNNRLGTGFGPRAWSGGCQLPQAVVGTENDCQSHLNEGEQHRGCNQYQRPCRVVLAG